MRLRRTQGEAPAGAVGTVVHRYKDGAAFEVEIAGDPPLLVTAAPEAIERLAPV